MPYWNNGWNAAWTFFWVFAFVAYLFSLFAVVGDLFRDHRLSGTFKAVWLLFLVFVPFLTVLVYLVVRGPGMQRRRERQDALDINATETYVRNLGLRHSPANEISKAKALAAAGVITTGEYESLKAHALSR
ncbi:PLDc N-terminal domain-containing protein [Nakamurella sp. UYEF19]|uniref:PLDc N-terminal domain-containing protein n=1 Tax=Nakamurella sp. UYEF19 TaxID=1756392 RepID=UPI0033950163